MEVLTLIQHHKTPHFPTLFNHPKITIKQPKNPTQIQISSSSSSRQTTHNNKLITKRTAAIKLASSTSILFFLLWNITTPPPAALAFDFRITVPEQTLEEAENGIRDHAESLLKVKDLLKEESWKAAQKALRKSSAYLKQDMYTIIQSKPGMERSELRKMYSVLFNGVSSLDYAARDKDVPRIWECYHNVVLALDNILQRI